jgi:hypothetical protein
MLASIDKAAPADTSNVQQTLKLLERPPLGSAPGAAPVIEVLLVGPQQAGRFVVGEHMEATGQLLVREDVHKVRGQTKPIVKHVVYMRCDHARNQSLLDRPFPSKNAAMVHALNSLPVRTIKH